MVEHCQAGITSSGEHGCLSTGLCSTKTASFLHFPFPTCTSKAQTRPAAPVAGVVNQPCCGPWVPVLRWQATQCSEAGYGEQGNLMQGWEMRWGLCINACRCQQHYGGNRNREVHWMCRFKHYRQPREREGSIGNTLLRSFAVQTHHTLNSVSYLARSISGWKCLLIKDTPLCHASAVVQQRWYRSGFPAQLCFLLCSSLAV